MALGGVAGKAPKGERSCYARLEYANRAIPFLGRIDPMEIAQLIQRLSSASACPYPAAAVEIRQTHISAVFLAGDFVYKVKKPVRLSFLDYSTLALRRHFCDEEVRLNRRLAPDVYLGVVPITEESGTLRFEGRGEPLEWAVKMRRLPDKASLLERVQRGEVDAGLAAAVGRRVAAFHAEAARSERIASFGRFDIVSGNILGNLRQVEPKLETTLSRTTYARLTSLTESTLERLRRLIDDRARRGIPRDTHGDLHLDHIYYFPDRPPPGDLPIVDCIEFNEQFRYADPIADMAFLAMDLVFHGRRDLADAFADAYFTASADVEGRALLPLYISYRAAVRGKVDGMQLDEPEIPPLEREAARTRAQAHWLLALSELESPGRRPCLLLVAGLPGAGKSTLARGLAECAGFQVIRSDAVRKELAAAAPEGENIYTQEWNDRTYRECLRRAEAGLFAGERALVDANFREENQRGLFLSLAARWQIPALLLHCQVNAETAHRRLGQRTGDVSDADWQVFQKFASAWEPPGAQTRAVLRVVDANQGSDECVRQATTILRKEGLLAERRTG